MMSKIQNNRPIRQSKIPKILLVDDDQFYSKELKYALMNHFELDYIHAYEDLANRDNLREFLFKYDLFLFDIHTPGMDGISFIKEYFLQYRSDFCYFIITNTENSNSITAAFELSPIDLLHKQLTIEEMIIRLHRAQILERRYISNYGILCDVISQSCSVRDERINLTQKEFILLSKLLGRSDYPKEEMINLLWQDKGDTSSLLRAMIFKLNQKLLAAQVKISSTKYSITIKHLKNI